MILGFVILYLLLSVGVGLAAARRVHTAKDFAVAGRSLPLPIVIATVFATWFGAEAVLGIPAMFVKEGLRGVVADPFGSSLCLVLVGLFFAPRFYRLNLLTVGDFYRLRYNRVVELLCAVCIAASYLGWVAAQFKVFGLILSAVTGGAVSQPVGMVIGAVIVLAYTTFGGMFSVAILDFVQISVIIGGLLYIASVISGLVGGVGVVIDHAASAGKLDFFPPASFAAWIPFVGAWVTMMLGSIPQQDVFQRVTSAKDERTAVRGSLLGGALYFCFCFVPMFLAYAATLVDPALFNTLLAQDSQLVLPTLIMQHTPVLAQILFFGAVLSAVMSCASATLLAPSVILSENVIKGVLPHLSDGEFSVRRPGPDHRTHLHLQHLSSCGQHIQCDARDGFRSTLCRALLVPSHDARSLLCLCGRVADLDRAGIVRSVRFGLASATARLTHGGDRDGCRFASASENRNERRIKPVGCAGVRGLFRACT
jgi:solute:Na+ symporter, SSS family